MRKSRIDIEADIALTKFKHLCDTLKDNIDSVDRDVGNDNHVGAFYLKQVTRVTNAF